MLILNTYIYIKIVCLRLFIIFVTLRIKEMLKLSNYIFIVGALIFAYAYSNSDSFYENDNCLGFGLMPVVCATNGRHLALEGRDRHHIKRNLNHCWRRYDGYNLQNTLVNNKEQLKKPYGILCNFACTWFFTISFPTCEFIYDYKLSCYLFTSLPDCTGVTCTFLNYFT